MRFLHDTEPVTWFIISFGAISVVTGGICFVIITKSKDLRNKFYLLYIGVAIDDIIMGAAYIGTGVKRQYNYAFQLGDVQTRWTCCWESMVLYFSQTLGLYMATTLTIDRILSVVIPQKYKVLKVCCFSCPLIGCALALSFFETVYMMFQGRKRNDMLISCGTGSCWSKYSYMVTLYAHLSISFLLVGLNVALIIIIRYLLEKAKKKNLSGWLNQAKIHLRVDILKTLTIVILSHGSSHITTRLGLLVLWYVSSKEPELTLLGMCLRNLVVINSASHFFIYYSTSSEFRNNTNTEFGKIKNFFPRIVKVQQISSQQCAR